MSNKKKEMEVLAQEINTFFMKREEFDCPSFDELLAAALNLYEIESVDDIRFMADAIEEANDKWDMWTAEWLIEDSEARSQARWEDANRGEI